MSQASDAAFTKAHDDFLGKLRPYNTKQRKEIYQLLVRAYSGILASFPAPRFEDEPLSPMDGAVAPFDPSDSSRLRKAVADFELLLNDKMYAAGQDKSAFQRFDSKLTGFVTVDQFRAVSATLGVLVADVEITGIVNKYDVKRDGTISYDDLWKVLLALREVPRSSSQDAFSTALVGRKNPTQAEVDALIAKAKSGDSVEIRLERGLKALRDNMYLKSSNFHAIFQALQNENKTVAVDDVVPQLGKLGFPVNLCSESELKQAATQYTQEKVGELTYQEFLSFFLGHDPVENVNAAVAVTFADQPNLQHALVKVNNLNLRKLFKDLDGDMDGCITSDELIHALTEQGLSESFKRGNNFKDYVETFSQKKKGFFGYAEFLKFVNQRMQQSGMKASGQLVATSTAPPAIVNESLSASEIMDLIVNRQRSSNVSVESVLKHFDSNDDGIIELPEFFQALCELGFQISNASAASLYEAFDASSTKGLDISEFAKTVANPFRNSKLSVRVRHAPGGESSIPFGSSYVNPDTVETPRKSTIRVVQTPTREASFDVSSQLTAPNTEERRSVKLLQPIGGTTNIDLSFIAEESTPRVARPETRGALDGTPAPCDIRSTTPLPDAVAFEKPKSRPPPGGASSISFTNDHGYTPQRSGVVLKENQSTAGASTLISFDPAAPTETVAKPRPHTAGGKSTLVLSDAVDESSESEAQRRAFAVLQSPGGNSSISFGAEPEKHKPIQRVLASPGGNSTFSLAHDSSNTPITPNAQRPQDRLNIDLTFDPSRNDPVTPKRLWKTVDGALGSETNVQIAHSHRNEPAASNGPDSARTRKAVENGGTGTATMGAAGLGSDEAAHVLNHYKGEAVAIDMALLSKIADVIYAHSQRLRHTFQEFTKGLSPSLSKENFSEGVRGLGLTVEAPQIDALFQRFDADMDGAITYSEFVRMLSTKE